MKTLTLIGYWKSALETEWPDPAWFLDNRLKEEEKKRVVDYLKRGCYMPYVAGGSSWCRFRCKTPFLGSREQTDGEFLWPEKLWHYVEEHNLRLPPEFIQQVNTNKNIPSNFDVDFTINKTWWLNQKGTDQTQHCFLTDNSKGELIIKFMNPDDYKTNIPFLKTIKTYQNKSIQDLKALLLNKQPIRLFCLWTDYRDLIELAPKGIEINFVENEIV